MLRRSLDYDADPDEVLQERFRTANKFCADSRSLGGSRVFLLIYYFARAVGRPQTHLLWPSVRESASDADGASSLHRLVLCGQPVGYGHTNILLQYIYVRYTPLTAGQLWNAVMAGFKSHDAGGPYRESFALFCRCVYSAGIPVMRAFTHTCVQ